MTFTVPYEGVRVLSPDLSAFFESGAALIIGTVGVAGEPCASRAWGCRVLDPTGRLRVLIGGDDDAVAANLTTTQRVALTATDPLTLRSAQAKGRADGIEPPSADDRALAARYVEAFLDVVSALDALERDVVARAVPADLVAVDLVVDELYDQTPGPSAGAPVTS